MRLLETRGDFERLLETQRDNKRHLETLKLEILES